MLHSLTSWVIAWCGIYIQSCIFPFFIQLFNIFCIISICIIQDVHLGVSLFKVLLHSWRPVTFNVNVYVHINL